MKRKNIITIKNDSICMYYIPREGSKPRFLSSLYSWQTAQGRQQQWTRQSPQGSSGKLKKALNFVRYVHV